jgi:hypothetical protein
VNLRERAQADLALTMEDSGGAGTAYTLIGPDGSEYAVTGVVGDISLLYSSAVPGYNGEELIRNRTIRCSCRIGTLAAQTEAVPARGWRARVPGFNEETGELFVAGCDPDRTLGVYHFVMALDPDGEEEE